MGRKSAALVTAVLALGAGAVATRPWWMPHGAVAQGPQANTPRPVTVTVARAEKKTVPVLVESLGTVTPIASVAIKARVDSEIVGVHFADGARVKQGDVLFTLDGRSLEAQIRQAEGTLARDKAQLEGAERDMRRYTELVAKGATPITNLDNARTQADTFRAAMKSDEGQIENLKVQLDYCTIRAPITGRMSMAATKIGNLVRSADLLPLATILQTAPVYLSFTVPQRGMADLRQALAAESATVEAIVPGAEHSAVGAVTMIENTVDPATGLVTVRATMPNDDELLWPGMLVTAQLTLRHEEAVTVPAAAVQTSQTGTYVFVVRDGVANVQPVKTARTVQGETVLESGLVGNEAVVTDGHLLLTDGVRVTPNEKTGA